MREGVVGTTFSITVAGTGQSNLIVAILDFYYTPWETSVMTKKLLLSIILLFGLFLCFLPPLVEAAPLADEATPTPTPAEEAATTTTTTTAITTTAEATEPTLTALLARLDALQAQVDELETHLAADPHAENANQVGTAVYLLDTAGLHDLDVQLNEEKVLDPAASGRVARLVRLLSAVTWPAALEADAHALLDLLDQLATVLADDNLAAAAPLATQVHEMQHDFSHTAEHWLGEAATPQGAAGQAFRVTSAVYLLDSAGLHDLDVRLNEEQVIEPADAGKVARVVRLLATVDWPEALATEAVTLTTALNDLATALADDNLETAAPLATQVHEVQHDFSHAAEHWLTATMGAHDNGADSHADEGATEAAGDGHDHAEGEGDDHEQKDDHKDSSGG